jgi:hypothetical protein
MPGIVRWAGIHCFGGDVRTGPAVRPAGFRGGPGAAGASTPPSMAGRRPVFAGEVSPAEGGPFHLGAPCSISVPSRSRSGLIPIPPCPGPAITASPFRRGDRANVGSPGMKTQDLPGFYEPRPGVARTSGILGRISRR